MARLRTSSAPYVGEVMSSSVDRLVRLGETVAGSGDVVIRVSAELKGDIFTDLYTCTL